MIIIGCGTHSNYEAGNYATEDQVAAFHLADAQTITIWTSPQIMFIDICEEFALENSVLYNDKKTNVFTMGDLFVPNV